MTGSGLKEWLSAAGAKYPFRTALEQGERRLSYQELDIQSRRVADHLIAHGAREGTKVALLFEDPLSLIAAILGVIQAGGVFIPLDPSHPHRRLELLISAAEPDCFMSETALAGQLVRLSTAAPPRAPVLLIDNLQSDVAGFRHIGIPATNRDGQDGQPERLLADLGYIYFTSGTTGRPKAIAGSMTGLSHFVEWEIRSFGVTEMDRVSQLHSPSFDPFLRDVFVPLCSGGTVCVPESREVLLDPERLARWIERTQITIIHCVPALLRAIMHASPAPATFEALRLLLVAGEPLFSADVKKWMAIHGDRIDLVNLYGPTETTLAKLYHRVRPADRDRPTIPVGKPIDGAHALVLDESGQLCPPGVTGEVHIRTPFRPLGYYQHPELTSEVFIRDPFSADPDQVIYRTGDLGRVLVDGNLELCGRKDHQVKVRGIRIELTEIEKRLRDHPEVADAAVKDWGNAQGEKFLAAYVVLSSGVRTDPPEHLNARTPEHLTTELRAFLSEYLPEQVMPAAFVPLPRLPRNPSGKIDRQALPHPISVTCPEAEHQPAGDAIEEKLIEIWQAVLQVEGIRPHDDFFALGGHSLTATQVRTRIRRELQADLDLSAFFRARTVAAMATIIHTQAGDGERKTDGATGQRGEREDTGNVQLQIDDCQFAIAPNAGAPSPRPRERPVAPSPRLLPDLPLSFAQQRLWFLDQLEPESRAYHLHTAIRLEGSLQVEALEQSLNEIVRRHEALRTRFPCVEGQPWQVIEAAPALRLPVQDLPECPEGERPLSDRLMATEQAQQPFDLARGSLFRASLFRLGNEEHLLFLTMHHIVSDGWSKGVLMRELAVLYEAFAAGSASPLPELPVQYGDFALWQRQWLQDDILKSQIDYWKEQLAGALPLPELPAERARPAVQSLRGARQPFRLSRRLTEALHVLSRKLGVTPFMSLLAAFNTMLFRYTGQDDLLVGTPIANRKEPEIEGLIGFFVNSLVLRTDLSGNPTFTDLLGRVREVALAAYSHQDLPFEQLVEELQPDRSLNRHPLFQVMFVFQNAPASTQGRQTERRPMTDSPDSDGGGLNSEVCSLEFRRVELDSGTAKFDLTLELSDTPDGLEGWFEYSTDLFDGGTIARMAEHFLVLLEGIVAHPEARLLELPLLMEAERQQLLVQWNTTQAEYPREECIHQRFEAQVKKSPEAVALIFGEERLTYRQLNERANQVAHYLRRLGVAPEVPVGVCMERSLEMVVALLGILKAGGAYVPLDPSYPQERLAFMLVDAQAPVLLTQERLLESCVQAFTCSRVQEGQDEPGTPERLNARTPGRMMLLCLDAGWERVAGESPDDLECVSAPDNRAYVIYTSGSTGRPKGVCVPHRGVMRLVCGADYAELSDQEVFLQFAPISFDASTFEIWGSLLNGARLVIFPPHTPSMAELGEAMQRHGVTTLWLTAGLFHQMVEHHPAHLKRLRQLLAGGDVLSVQHVRRAVEGLIDGRLINGYGPTESTTFACCCPLTALPQEYNSVPIGRPIANTQVYLLDRQMQPVPVGVPGELYIGGDGLARGYLNQAGLTAEKFVPDPFGREPGGRLYRTGDLARYLPDGNIEFLGRLDHQVKVRGYRIELGEIEAALMHHPEVEECVVLAREDQSGDKRLAAYVVLKEGVWAFRRSRVEGHDPERLNAQTSERLTVELRHFLKSRLPDTMIPSAVVEMNAMPLTPNGKVDRRALPEPEGARGELQQAFVAPRTAREHHLTRIWEEILQIRPIGVMDSFFDLGGHSLLAVRLMARIRKELRYDLPLAALFQGPTIEQLAVLLHSADKEETECKVPGARLSDPAPHPAPRNDYSSDDADMDSRVGGEELEVGAGIVSATSNT